MQRKQIDRQQTVDQTKDTAQRGSERADFVSFSRAPQGKVQQSLYETKWAAYQPWAAAERPDRNFGTCLTPEAREALAQERDHADNRH